MGLLTSEQYKALSAMETCGAILAVRYENCAKMRD